MTSHDVIYRVRKKLGQKKVGHSGTLDPNATGVLVLALGEATKYLQYIKDNEKAYEAEIIFGLKTDTDDITGTIIEEKEVESLSREDLEKIIPTFLGEQDQIPPIYSAKKVNGKKLYEYARKNESVEIKPNRIFIKDLELLDCDGKRARLKVDCSRGTYVRSIARDLGEKLDIPSTMGDLRRTRSGPFYLKDAVSLEDLDKAEIESHLISIKDVLDYPVAEVVEDSLKKIHCGQELKPEDLILEPHEYVDGEIVKIICGDKFYGIGIVSRRDDSVFVKPRKMLRNEE